MKRKSIKLTLPSPCESSESEMFRVLDGRFCKSCSRIVVDFKKMSDKQLIEYFTKHKGKICGEFHPHQLNKDLVTVENSGMESLRTKGQSLAIAASLALSATITSIDAQTPAIGVRNALLTPVHHYDGPTCYAFPEFTTTKIDGIVRDAENLPLIGAVVFIENTPFGTSTDTCGQFTLEISLEQELITDLYLVAVYTGFEKTSLPLKSILSQGPVEIKLKEQITALPEVCVTGYRPGGTVGNISYSVYVSEMDAVEKTQSTEEALPENELLVFPNPFVQDLQNKLSLVKADHYEIHLFDETGKVHWSEMKYLDRGINEFEIHLRNYVPPANYFLLIRSKEMQLSQMVVKSY